jgi:acetyltransferase
MAPPGVEVFVAARREPLLGPLIVVGSGGVDVERDADIAMRLAPVTAHEAREMLGELRGPTNVSDALVAAVMRVSELAAALPQGVATVEINPLLVTGSGVLMLDAALELEDGWSR